MDEHGERSRYQRSYQGSDKKFLEREFQLKVNGSGSKRKTAFLRKHEELIKDQMMTIPTVEDLYKAYEVIANTDKDEKERKEAFDTVLNGCSGGASEKRLASQFIARFFNDQEREIQEKAFYRMIDLCEDEEVIIRRQAILDLGTLGRKCPEFQSRISDVLVQMLTAEDQQEHMLVEQALVKLLAQDARATLNGIFTQILVASSNADIDDNGEEGRSNSELMRESAIKFLAIQLKRLPEETLKSDLETYVVEQVKKILEDVSEEEFLQLITILASLKCMSSLTGRQNLVNLISEQVVGTENSGSFDPTDAISVAKVTECARQAVQYLSKNVHAASFVVFFLDKVIPGLDKVPREDTEGSHQNGDSTTPPNNPRLNLLRAFSQMCIHHGPQFEANDARIEPLLKALISEMPLPPTSEAEQSLESSKTDQEELKNELHFSEVECLLFALHRIGRLNTEFISKDEERLKDFRVRLQYFSRRTEIYLRSLQSALQSKTKEELNSGDNKLRVVALKLTNNINHLIRDLFKNPISYKTNINLSWISPNSPSITADAVGGKRPAAYEEDIGDGDSAKRRSNERVPYKPPMGKYSDRAGAPPAFRGRGGGWNRGGRGRRY